MKSDAENTAQRFSTSFLLVRASLPPPWNSSSLAAALARIGEVGVTCWLRL